VKTIFLTGMFEKDGEFGPFWTGTIDKAIPAGSQILLTEINPEKEAQLKTQGKAVPTFWMKMADDSDSPPRQQQKPTYRSRRDEPTDEEVEERAARQPARQAAPPRQQEPAQQEQTRQQEPARTARKRRFGQ